MNTSIQRPFSQACENNKDAIFGVLEQYVKDVDRVLEVGSGTGQHAVYFAEQLPHLLWQPADQEPYLEGINAWINSVSLPNVLPPLILNFNSQWPTREEKAIFSANTVHIMSWAEVLKLFDGIRNVLLDGGIFCLYGPFNYNGSYTSESNANFDQWLQQRDPLSGIRDFEAVDKLAKDAGLSLLADHEMPANNRCLVWRKKR